MKSIDELMQAVAEGDEEAQTELRERFLTVEQDKARVARDLKLKTDTTLRERYPRALRAWEKGKLKLADDMDDAALVEALKEQEEFFAEMGVPVETSPAQAASPATDPEGGEVPVKPVDDPAKALAGGRAAQSPGGQPRDYVAEWMDAMKGSTIRDRERANAIIVELNAFGQRNPERAQAMMDQINASIEARPIGTRRF